MTLNFDSEITNSESLIKLGNTEIKNVLEFKYLGVMLSPENPTRLIEHRIASATAKFHELKKVFTNNRISIKTRGRYLNAFVRSRLCYNIATWNNPEHFVNKLDVEWHQILRKSIKGGFRRRENGHYYYTNVDLRRIIGVMSIERYAERQQLKWIAHCIRMENDTLQKLSLFMIPSKKYYRNVWTRIENKTGLTKSDFIRKAMDKSSFNSYIANRYGSFDE